jgi:hypothetical protein
MNENKTNYTVPVENIFSVHWFDVKVFKLLLDSAPPRDLRRFENVRRRPFGIRRQHQPIFWRKPEITKG